MCVQAVMVFGLMASSVLLASGNRVVTVGLNKMDQEYSLEMIQKHNHAVKNFEGSGILPLFSDSLMSFYGSISLGTPPQTMNVAFLCSVSDLAVLSSKMCVNDPQYCDTNPTYSHNTSSTYKSNGSSIYGDISKDNLQVAGLSITGQQFVESLDDFNTVFGLGPQKGSLIGATPPFVNMINQGVVDQPVFSFFLNKNNESLVGELMLGGVDPSHYSGDFTYAPAINTSSYWMIKLDGVYVNNIQIGNSSAQNLNALVEPALPVMMGPQSLIDAIHKALGLVQVGNVYTVNCSAIDSLADVSILIHGKSFVLHPQDYIIKVNQTECYSGFLGMSLEYLTLGQAFVRNYYTIFDMGNNRIGFADASSADHISSVISTVLLFAILQLFIGCLGQ